MKHDGKTVPLSRVEVAGDGTSSNKTLQVRKNSTVPVAHSDKPEILEHFVPGTTNPTHLLDTLKLTGKYIIRLNLRQLMPRRDVCDSVLKPSLTVWLRANPSYQTRHQHLQKMIKKARLPAQRSPQSSPTRYHTNIFMVLMDHSHSNTLTFDLSCLT